MSHCPVVHCEQCLRHSRCALGQVHTALLKGEGNMDQADTGASGDQRQAPPVCVMHPGLSGVKSSVNPSSAACRSRSTTHGTQASVNKRQHPKPPV